MNKIENLLLYFEPPGLFDLSTQDVNKKPKFSSQMIQWSLESHDDNGFFAPFTNNTYGIENWRIVSILIIVPYHIMLKTMDGDNICRFWKI